MCTGILSLQGMRNGLDTLLDLANEVQGVSVQDLSAGGFPPSKAEIEAESFIIAARHHLRRLLENLAGGRSLDFLRMALMDFQNATCQDDVFNRYTRALKVFLQRSIDSPQFVSQGDYYNTSLMMLEGAQQVARRHEEPTERLLYEIDELENAIRSDEVTHRLATTSNQLIQGLFYNEQGRMVFKPQLIDDLRYRVRAPLWLSATQLLTDLRVRAAGSGRWVVGSLGRAVGSGCWVVGSGCWVVGSGCWVGLLGRGSGCWVASR